MLRCRLILLIPAFFSLIPSQASAQSIQTVVGLGISGFGGDGGPAINAELYSPTWAALDSAGNIYIADTGNNRIRAVNTGSNPITIAGVTIQPGNIATVAGNGACCFYADGTSATGSALNYAHSVALDAAGNLYLADMYNNRIRVVNTGTQPIKIAGVTIQPSAIATVVGNGVEGYGGDGGPPTSAEIDYPTAAIVDHAGNIYIADTGSNRIRLVNTGTSPITLAGVTIQPGTIGTVAGVGSCCYSGDGKPATSAQLYYPHAIGLDHSGNIYIADMYNFRIRAVNVGTSAVTIAGITIQPGNIETIAGNGVQGFSGDGGPAISAKLSNAEAVWPDSAGNVYIADTDNFRIRVVNSNGIISTLAGNGTNGFNGDGIPATTVALNQPLGMDFDPAGNIVFADRANQRIRKVVLNATGGSGGGVAQFVKRDNTTEGNWQGTYGADGYYVINGLPANIPGYATLGVTGGTPYTWTASTSDVRAIETGNGPGGTRIAATWYGSTITFDLNMGASAHQFALYALDWDSGGRSESIAITDAVTNALLNSQSLTAFSSGAYLVWNITGHVKVSVTLSGGANAVVSGVFFGTGSSSTPVLSIAKTHTGNFAQGQNNATYGVTVSNSASAATSGTVTVTESVPTGMTLVSISGTGWTCPANGNNCTRSDALNPVASYPPITVTVNVLANATSPQVNQVSVSGGGSAGASASDSTIVTAVSNGGPSVQYVGADTTTLGSWQGKYGADGYALANSVQNLPTYDTTFAQQGGTPYTWVASTTDPRALLIPGGSSGIASAWYSVTSFSFDVNMGASTHQFALYTLDWDRQGRSETIQIVDANNPGTALDITRTVASFGNGVYLIWNITGHVKIIVTFKGGSNAVISGAFFGGAGSSSPSASPSLSITKTHTGNFTQGQQNATYTVAVSNAANAGPTSGPVTVTETVPTTGMTLVSMAGTGWACPANSNSCTRSDALNAGLSYQPITVTVNVLANATSPQVNQVSVTGGGSATANASDSTTITVANVGAAAAQFIKQDSATEGNWQGTYGADGYIFANVASSLIPSYATFAVQGQANYTWAATTGDMRAPLVPGATSQRIAAAWYNYPSFGFDINFTDGNSHQFALYALDWDSGGRAEAIKITDATSGALLDSRSISSFNNGTYLVWTISGHVKITVNLTGGPNAVISGAFFK